MARTTSTQEGTVVGTVGRLVRVRTDDGDRDCQLVGQRAVIGDRVRVRDGQGAGAIEAVLPRRTELRRADPGGRPQVIAANLDGLLITASAANPPMHAPLVDRYVLASREADLEPIICLTKVELGVSEDVAAALAVRARLGFTVLYTSAHRGDGVDEVRARIEAGGVWALVGPSGTGKTSLAQALLPEVAVGAVGTLSEHDRMGRHTTTASTLFPLGAGWLADSPGIRTFLPDVLDAEEVARRFPGVDDPPCRYRDCLHREGEDGCAAPDTVDPVMLDSYRRLMAEILTTRARVRPSPSKPSGPKRRRG